ncbi:anthrax toxin-like adenylyl cyclase domain-containing protein [Providencia manganoxydans]|uniref:anthrax toxin-like adenylyl cyclase domain-containing protein n=1 Tax=Providencia manganoxydans TaxID=2923283 RepID=UPI0034E5A8E3
MPNVNNSSDTLSDFNQGENIAYLDKFNLTELINKLILEYSDDISYKKGLCVGFTYLHMIYAKNNLSTEFIKLYTELNRLLDIPLKPADPILFYRQKAIQKLAIAKLNQMTIIAAVIQKNSNQFISLYNVNNSHKIPENMNNESFQSSIKKIIEHNKMLKANENFMVYYYENYNNIEKAVIQFHSYIKGSLSDDIVNQLSPRFKEYARELENKFQAYFKGNADKISPEESMNFIKSVTQYMKIEASLKIPTLLQQYGITLYNTTQSNTPLPPDIKETFIHVDDFFKQMDNSSMKKKSTYYTIGVKGHQFGIEIKYDSTNGKFSYILFEPNSGEFIADNYNRLKFLAEYYINHYGTLSNKKHNDLILYSEFTYDKKNENNLALPKITEQEISHLTHKYYVDNKLKSHIGTTGYILEYHKFNNEKGITTLTLRKGESVKKIHTNLLDAEKLHSYIEYHIATIQNQKKDIFIDSEGKTYYINNQNKLKQVFDGKIPSESFTTQFIQSDLSTIPIKKHTNTRQFINPNLTLTELAPNQIVPDINMPISVQRAISDAANNFGVIIAIRDLDPKIQSIMESGSYRSKGTDIHAEVADWGPHAGFIPLEQRFANSQAKESAEKYSQYAQDAIDSKKAVKIDLIISETRVEQLQQQFGALSELGSADKDNYHKITASDGNSTTEFLLKKITNPDNSISYQVYYKVNDEIVPFKVLGDVIEQKPLTAYYEITSANFDTSKINHHTNPSSYTTWEEWKKIVDGSGHTLNASDRRAYNDESYYKKYDMQDNLNINLALESIAKSVNNKSDRAIGYEIIRYSSVNTRPDFQPNDRFPVIYFISDAIQNNTEVLTDIGRFFTKINVDTIIIRSPEELYNIQHYLKHHDYHVPINANWDIDVPNNKIYQYLNSISEFTSSYGLLSVNNRIPADIKKITWKLLMKIASGEIKIEGITVDKYPDLRFYYSTQDGNIDIKLIEQVIYDPLLSIKANQFFNDSLPFTNNNHTPKLIQQAIDVQIILNALYEDPSRIHHLSPQTIKRLKSFFPAGDSFDHAEIIRTLSDNKKFTKLINDLSRYIGIDSKLMTDDTSLLKTDFDAYQKFRASRLENYSEYKALIGNHVPNQNIKFIDYDINIDNDSKKITALHSLIESSSTNQRMQKFLGYISELKHKKNTGIITREESNLLNDFNKFFDSIKNISDIKSINRDALDLHAVVAMVDGKNIIQIKGPHLYLSITSKYVDNKLQVSIYDPKGTTVYLTPRYRQQADRVKLQLQKFLDAYLKAEVKADNGSLISRAELNGFLVYNEHNSNRKIRVNVTVGSKENVQFAAQNVQLNQLIDRVNVLLEKPKYVYFGKHRILFNTLVRLGAHVNGVPITAEHVKVPGWNRNLSFDPSQLSAELTMLTGHDKDLALLKILKQQLTDNPVDKLIINASDLKESHVLYRQLDSIKNKFSMESIKIEPSLIANLNKMGVTLPRYLRIANRGGQFMGGAGLTMAIKGIYEMHRMLDAPNLSDDEKRKIKKNLSLAYASIAFNYGDNVLQPILLNAAYRKAGSFNAANTFPARITILFNLVGMGIDTYQAYDAFSQLEETTDPLVRQDLIFSATTSVINIAIGGMTILGIAAGSTAVPVVGLIVGGIIMVAGMIYNTVRTIQEIEKHTALTHLERFQLVMLLNREYINPIFSPIATLPPVEKFLNDMLGDILRKKNEVINRNNHIQLFSTQNWLNELDIFKSTLLTKGYQSHFAVIEKPNLESTDLYYLVTVHDGKPDEYLGGKLAFDSDTQTLYRSEENAKLFTKQQAEYLLANYLVNYSTGRALDPKNYSHNRANYNRNFVIRKKTLLKSYQQVGSDKSDEIIIFNNNYSSKALTDFLKRKSLTLPSKNKSLSEQINSLNIHQLNLFRLKNNYVGNDHPDIQKFSSLNDNPQEKRQHLLSLGHNIINDRNAVSSHLIAPDSKGLSIHSGNGTDIIIGFKNRENSFTISDGDKFFAGGDRNDIFNLSLNNIEQYLTNDALRLDRYLDGGNGSDTLNIQDINDERIIEFNLSDNNLIVKKSNNSTISNHVANVENIENVILSGSGHKKHTIKGNEKNNLLDGGSLLVEFSAGDGNDYLVLEQGDAKGGNGEDHYYIRRFQWHTLYADFFESEEFFDLEKQRFSIRLKTNEKYLSPQINIANIVIEEETNSSSEVILGYSLSEISFVSIDEDDIILQLDMLQDPINGITFDNISNKINIRLKNAFKTGKNKKSPHHNYQLKTRDGFTLDYNKNFIINKTTCDTTKLEPIYLISYHSNNDSINQSEQSIYINDNSNSIKIGPNNLIKLPAWGKLQHTGLINKLIYEGNNKNNQLQNINKDAYIYVSEGDDGYVINRNHFIQGEIIFDFSKVKDIHNDKFSLSIFIPTENGYNLKSDGNAIYLENPFGGKLLAVKFINLTADAHKKINLIDKNKTLFNLEFKNSKIQLNPPTDHFNGTTITNEKSDNKIIISDKDDSIIIANDGYNVLYSSGKGNNRLYGGKGQDVLISDTGSDYLDGDAGDDFYFINPNSEKPLTITVNDTKGNNHIQLYGCAASYSIFIDNQGNTYHSYKSGNHTINIRQGDKFINKVNHYNTSSIFDSLKEIYLRKQEKPHQLLIFPLNEIMVTHPNLFKNNPFSPSEIDGSLLINPTNEYQFPFYVMDYGYKKITDKSGYGRIFASIERLDSVTAYSGHNVFAGYQLKNDFTGGSEDDVFIIGQGTYNLKGNQGNNRYLLDGNQTGDITISHLYGNDHIHLLNFNQNPVKTELAGNMVQFIYTATSGRKLTLIQEYNQQAPSIFHHSKLQGLESDNEANKLGQLVNLLSYQRIADAEQSSLSSSGERIDNWNPVFHFDNYMKRAI